jgi:hypothetical protein
MGEHSVGSMFSGMAKSLRNDLPILLTAATLIALASLSLSWAGVPAFQGLGVYLYNMICIASAWIVLSILLLAPDLWRDRPKSPIRYLVSRASGPGGRARVQKGVAVVVAVIAFSGTFNMFKSAIPLFAPYTWDETLIVADRAIHFGQDPWRLLQPIFGSPLISSMLALLYHLWFLLIYVGTIWFAIYEKNAVLRQRYLIAYLLIWSVIGMAFAVGLASVGPAFVRPILGIGTFDAQMAHLRAADAHWPIFTLRVQSELLEWHRLGAHGFGRGISAMPSMHVALAFLFFLAMRHVSKAAGQFFGIFFVLILIGSVHLGYHYALDGYVAIIITGAIWKLAAIRLPAPVPAMVPST